MPQIEKKENTDQGSNKNGKKRLSQHEFIKIERSRWDVEHFEVPGALYLWIPRSGKAPKNEKTFASSRYLGQ